MRLGTLAVGKPATLFFRCKVGSNATIRYGSGSQPCPGQNGLLGLTLTPGAKALPLSVEALADTEWVVSVEWDTRR